MNRREIVVLSILIVAFAAGTLSTLLHKWRLHRQPIHLSVAVDSTTVGYPLDVNTATEREFEALPGIGPVLAVRIVEYRETRGRFKKVTELRRIPGIGPKRLAAIAPFLQVVEAGERSTTP